jgi:uncharacterized protein (DUF433 family)
MREVKPSAKAADDPRLVGVYPFPEAGRLLQGSPATLRSWVSKGLALASPPDMERLELLSFHDLIGLLVVRELRHRGVSLRSICTAHRYMVSELGLERPFAHQRFWTRSHDVFVKILLEGTEHPVAASRYGQISFADFLEESLHGVEYGPDLLASVWRPVRQVWINPRIRQGSPCLDGTRVDTWVLYDLHLAGESAEYLATLYELPINQIAAALEWEERRRKKAA